uniref:NYN domain-containing protein n=1 Tax=Aromatoleum sp. TaxID=2307007 RepID=UPI002FC5DCE0
RDAKYEKFDIKRVLERLLLKGSIVVKKAYCDWERYKGFKATMHEASFELIEIPHVRQSGKNSADIRLVVDALDLCYTKSHVNTFVIISGDSDFSPLVSKLRENAKQVIGVGVKQSTSDLLIANCDEFIFYDDLVRESERAAAKQDTREAQPAAKRSPDEEKRRREEQEKRKTQAVELAVETFDALVAERGDSGKIWASLLKEAIKRRQPGFNESYYGFRAFGNLLEEAQARGLLDLGRDEKSGAYVYRHNGGADAAAAETSPHREPSAAVTEGAAEDAAVRSGSRRRRGGQPPAEQAVPSEPPPTPDIEPALQHGQLPEPDRISAAPAASTERPHRSGRRGHGRKPATTAPGERSHQPETPPTAEARGPVPAAAALPATAPATTAPTGIAPTAETRTVAPRAITGSERRPAAAIPSPPPRPVGTGASRTGEQPSATETGSATTLAEAPPAEQPAARDRQRRGRKPAASNAEHGTAPAASPEPAASAPGDAGSAVATEAATAETPAPQRKPARARRPRKAETTPDEG